MVSNLSNKAPKINPLKPQPPIMGMTVGALRAILAQLPADTLIILAGDSEGNVYSPVGSYNRAMRYVPHPAPYPDGELYTIEDPTLPAGQGQRALVLWPKH